jgi:hypothetical protein
VLWKELNPALLDCLGEAHRIEWERASLDSASVPAKRGGRKTGPNPTHRGKPGSKRHVVSDRGGVPLAAVLTAANASTTRSEGPRRGRGGHKADQALPWASR